MRHNRRPLPRGRRRESRPAHSLTASTNQAEGQGAPSNQTRTPTSLSLCPLQFGRIKFNPKDSGGRVLTFLIGSIPPFLLIKFPAAPAQFLERLQSYKGGVMARSAMGQSPD